MRSILALAFGCLALPAFAQTSLLTASPIPDGAESRFCYYAGMAYSKSAYILIGGDNAAVQAVGTTGNESAGLSGGGIVRAREEQKPLQCVEGDDGVLQWTPVATIQINQ